MKKTMILLILIICLTSLIGCWNMREVNDMGVAVAIGIDLTEDQLIEVTVQVLVPRRLTQEGYEGNAVATYSTTGRTFLEIFRKLTTISSRKIYIGHIQLIVLGEDFAKKGILEASDFFERDHEFRRQAHVAITHGISAREVMETGSIIELIPAFHITKSINNSIHSGSTRILNLMQLFKELNNPGNQLVIPTIHKRFNVKPEVAKELRVVGTSVFNKERLVGYLDEYETRGYLWARGELKGGIIVLPSPEDPVEHISLELLKVDGRMNVIVVEDEIILSVKVISESSIGEQQTTLNLTTPEMLEYLKKKSEEVIMEEIKKTIGIAQNDLKTDFLGFGEIVYKQHPNLWNILKEDWDEIFSNLPIKIDVTSNIRRSGQILKPSIPR